MAKAWDGSRPTLLDKVFFVQAVSRDKRVGAAGLLVAIWLMDEDRSQGCYPSQSRLVHLTGASRSRVQRGIYELVDADWIRCAVRGGPRRSTRYWLNYGRALQVIDGLKSDAVKSDAVKSDAVKSERVGIKSDASIASDLTHESPTESPKESASRAREARGPAAADLDLDEGARAAAERLRGGKESDGDWELLRQWLHHRSPRDGQTPADLIAKWTRKVGKREAAAAIQAAAHLKPETIGGDFIGFIEGYIADVAYDQQQREQQRGRGG